MLPKSKLALILFSLLMVSLSYAQQRSCSTNEFMTKKNEDLNFRNDYKERQALFQKYIKTRENRSVKGKTDTIIVPVAVHFPTEDELLRSCLVDLVKDQVRILNEDFSAINNDFSKWEMASVNYPNINSGAVNVKFILATKNHPENTDENLLEGEPAVTIGWQFNELDADSRWAGYQNFVVKPISGGVLGYSPLGGDPATGEAVVISSSAFGSTSGCGDILPATPFNLGRTVTHELGHFYNLDHTWGGSGSCNLDDNVSDTPNISEPTYGCVAPGSITLCGNTSLTTNYMDYVNDECMFMFTEGQADRMSAYLELIENKWKANVTEDFEVEPDDPIGTIENEFKIFPNPVNENITIIFPKNEITKISYSLHDLLGKLILNETTEISEETNEIKINTALLSEGVYILNFESSVFSKAKRLIVEH